MESLEAVKIITQQEKDFLILLFFPPKQRGKIYAINTQILEPITEPEKLKMLTFVSDNINILSGE